LIGTANFKVLYGTGAVRVNKDNEVVSAGGVKFTIKEQSFTTPRAF
jgi:hypothetical protein